MSENKFLRNLSQQNSQAVEPATTQPVGVPHHRRSENSPAEYDPIKRLTDELSRHSRAIEGLSTRIDRMEGRPRAATQTELQALLQEAREGVSFTINSEEIARRVLPELTKGLPTPAGIKAAADAGASTISSAGETTAGRIEQAGAEAASRIEWASKKKADKWSNTVGFTHWRSALLVGLLPLVIAGISIYKWSSTDTQLSTLQTRFDQLETTKQGWITFGQWVKVNFPEQWKTYTDPAYVPTNAYLKKVKPKQ